MCSSIMNLRQSFNKKTSSNDTIQNGINMVPNIIKEGSNNRRSIERQKHTKKDATERACSIPQPSNSMKTWCFGNNKFACCTFWQEVVPLLQYQKNDRQMVPEMSPTLQKHVFKKRFQYVSQNAATEGLPDRSRVGTR